MTPQERAKNIQTTFKPLIDLPHEAVVFLAEQIEEAEMISRSEQYGHTIGKALLAVEDAYSNGFSAGFNDGFTSAKERAKGIAEDFGNEHISWEGRELADRISAMTPEEK